MEGRAGRHEHRRGREDRADGVHRGRAAARQGLDHDHDPPVLPGARLGVQGDRGQRRDAPRGATDRGLSPDHAMRAKLREETGAIALSVVILFPALMMLGVLAVDVGNWYVHKRELQIQADAGALAAAGYYRYPCDDTAISDVAREYAGGVRNRFARIPPDRLAFRLNQPTFFNQPGKPSPADTGMTGSPCADAAVDVKMTETDVPWFFGLPVAPPLNAQARVEIGRAACR